MEMSRKTKETESYPSIARWLQAYGKIEFGYCYQTDSFIRVLDEGGMMWSGSRRYPSLNKALADCEDNVARLLRNEFGEP
jgi:hypothetical protein